MNLARTRDRGHAPYYEGWYLRVTNPATGESYALMGSVFRPAPPAAPIGYGLVLNGHLATRIYVEFPWDRVALATDRYDVRVGPVHFHAAGGSGALDDGQHQVAWNVALADAEGWQDGRSRSPMGWAAHVPGMETLWHVLTLRARATGTLAWDGVERRVDGWPAYVEKVWGQVFPRRWFWLHAHVFDRAGAVLAASGGHAPLPIVPGSIDAAMVGWHDGERLHAFATHQGQRVVAHYEPGRWAIEATGLTSRLIVDASCDPATLVPLEGPTPRGMRPVARESLVGTASVVLEQRTIRGWRTRQRATSRLAGVEVGSAPE